MNTSVLIKEGRPLFWPWCVVMLTGLLSLVGPLHSIGWIGLLGIVLGVPLLATLPFGNEFQNRTLSLLLSQPVGRLRIWIEKSCAALIAVASVISVFAFSPLIARTLPDRGQQVHALGLIMAIVASAPFWTLIARSTIGGIALNVGTVLLIAAFSSLAAGVGANSLFVMTHFSTISLIPLVCYASLMLWLGGRAVARYQVTGTMAGDDLLTMGPDGILGAFAHRARSNPTQPVWNLVHKEFRLLRPVWLITALGALTWVCVTLAELLDQHKAEQTLPLTIVAFGVSCPLIIAILAGCLSLGEEKTSGTYAWHRTLPISAARQWSMKLFVGLLVSFVCAGVIPVLLLIAGTHLFPSAFSREPAYFELFWLLGALSVTLFSFWCACAVNGTVTAVAWAVPILAIFLATPEIGGWVAFRVVDFLSLKSHVFADFRFTVLLSGLGSSLKTNGLIRPSGTTSDPFVFWIPSLILAVVQSYYLFRTPIRESAFSVAQKLSPAVVLALLCSFFAFGFTELLNQARSRVFGSINSVNHAIQNVLSDSANREAKQPLQLSADDLKKAYPPHAFVSSWLQDATVSIVLDKAHPTTCCESHLSGRLFGRPWWNYTATVHLASGAELNLSFEPPAQKPAGPPREKVSVRWPDKTSEDTLDRF